MRFFRSDQERTQHMLDRLVDEDGEIREDQCTKRLSAFEIDFLGSIARQWKQRGSLSDRQVEILEGIYSEKTA